MTYITLMQNVMLLPHSELLCLTSAWIAWTILESYISSMVTGLSLFHIETY